MEYNKQKFLISKLLRKPQELDMSRSIQSLVIRQDAQREKLYSLSAVACALCQSGYLKSRHRQEYAYRLSVLISQDLTCIVLSNIPKYGSIPFNFYNILKGVKKKWV